MVNYPRWAMILTVVVALRGILYASPNFRDAPEKVVDADGETVEPGGLLRTKRMSL